MRYLFRVFSVLLICACLSVSGCSSKKNAVSVIPSVSFTPATNTELQPDGTQIYKNRTDSIFPIHALENKKLMRIYPDSNSAIIKDEITGRLEFSFSGISYIVMKYYKTDDILFYASNMFVNNNIVYGDLYQYTDKTNTLIDTKVRISSIGFAENTPEILYITNDENRSNELNLYTKGTKNILDTNVYKAYFTTAQGDLVYLKASSVSQIENTLNKYAGSDTVLNPDISYELRYKPFDGDILLMGNTGEIFSIDKDRNMLYASLGVTQNVYVNDIITLANIVVVPLRGGENYTVDNIIMDFWKPDNIYLPINYLIKGDPQRRDRLGDLYLADSYSAELIARNVLDVRYISADKTVFAYQQRSDGGSQIVLNHPDGTQQLIPKEYKVSLNSLNYDKSDDTVYFIHDTDEGKKQLCTVSLRGEPIVKIIATDPVVCEVADEGVLFAELNEYASSCNVLYYSKGKNPVKLASCTVYEGMGFVNHPAQRYIVSRNKDRLLYITKSSPGSTSYSLMESLNGLAGITLTDRINLNEAILHNSDFSQVAAVRTDSKLFITSDNTQYSVDGNFNILDNNGQKGIFKQSDSIWIIQE